MLIRTIIQSMRSWRPRQFSYIQSNLLPVYQNDLIYIVVPYSTSKHRKEDKDCHLSKDKIIKLLNFQSNKDALAFYKLPVKTLLHIYKVTKNDEVNGFCENRLYYLSHKIKCPTYTVSEKLAKRTFVYSLSFNWLSNSLEVLLENGVVGERILRDLWVLKYRSDTIKERLERVKSMGIDNLFPWMVRCSEEILTRYIELSQETKTILGETKSTQVYLANRLNIPPENVDKFCLRIPSLRTIRVTKVKHFLDLLLQEGFSAEDIAAKPRVLTSSPKTVQQRLNMLRKLGLNEINLNVLCRSKKDFKKYVESIESAIEDSKTNAIGSCEDKTKSV